MATEIPPAPAELRTSSRAGVCPMRDRSGDDDKGCPVCMAEYGAQAWVRLWTAGQAWLSPTTDLDVLVRLCKGHDEEQHHRAALAEDGFYVKGQRGGLVSHPAVRMLRAVTAEITRLESLCGFTPSDRGRLGIGEVRPQATRLETLLARRAAGR